MTLAEKLIKEFEHMNRRRPGFKLPDDLKKKIPPALPAPKGGYNKQSLFTIFYITKHIMSI